MKRHLRQLKWHFSLLIVLLSAALSGNGQTPPLLQDIKIYRDPVPVPTATPFVQRTGSSTPVSGGMRTKFPALAEVSVPGYSGILIESMDGNVVVENNSTAVFNPASNVKIATAYAVLKTFGPDFRFMTSVYTDGSFDRSTGTLNGNLYVSGRDPMFGFEHAVAIAYELNRLGIRTINGDLIATDNFAMN